MDDITAQQIHTDHVLYELNISAKILEQISEGVMVVNVKRQIIYINSAFEIVTGYNRKEVYLQNPRILQSGLHDKHFYHKLWETISSKGSWSGEIWNKRKNGELFLEWLTISEVRDSEGIVQGYIGVFSDITDRKKAEDELRKLAHYDALTGVPNRHSFTERFSDLLYISQQFNQKLALLFLDLDRFKQINDSLGHEAGDKLLIHVAGRLQELIKNKDVIARIGGDEFVIILSNIKHQREAVHIAKKIIESLTKSFIIDGQEVYITTSIGISFYPNDGDSSEILLKKADKAMYMSKLNGRNQYEIYHEGISHTDKSQIKMAAQLRNALIKNELSLIYQPFLNARSRKIEGVEAYCFWKSGVTPDELILLAEESGLIISLANWVLRQASEDIKHIHLAGFTGIRTTVNISPLHFQQEDFVKDIKFAIENSNIPARAIELELAEGVIMPQASIAKRKLVDLKKLGVKLTIDGFGAGYSSLSYLNRFPIDKLKIDKSFIENLGKYEDDASIVEAIIQLGKHLHLQVAADGVLNDKQYKLLKHLDCDMMQGNYICPPLQLQELIELLNEWDPSQIL
ncbi:putative bifunctional diguanylate cyclase/phosphodiesterase [Lederbergia wuyishanensis]|uniref:Diguanylate cyclase (GGDEF)-like protein/PAS domain S-box-containing protein n=1 Tax=Lederbergia wuyishanensis TaxID=1347903 RepID=A0ABU0D0U9_9BACI|nr:EAL domain-containing protein [Lederbergia wuyishanensis]MCJ8006634.1 EAL domain-containing protein [Lederbergia wuyishanensis]MDQ0342015.1 diguanylate cyclase (GGDEF)-like protein/PAS domain S-box-containing protein [Lederbergia wuyishanensis]